MDISDKRVRKIVFEKYDKRCAYCGCRLELNTMQIDHIEPLKRWKKEQKSHLNQMSNFNPSCKSCNSSKSTYSIEKWREEILMKHDRMMQYESTYRLLFRFGIIKKTNKEFKFYFEK